MQLSRLVMKNFRNFQAVDIPLGPHVVIVGENKSGKSNLAFALRLVLDPSIPDSSRYLRAEDFWDGLPRPLTGTEEIEIVVEFTGWDADAIRLASHTAYCTADLQVSATACDEGWSDRCCLSGIRVSRAWWREGGAQGHA